MGVSARKDTAFSGFCKDFFDFLIFAQSSGISGQSLCVGENYHNGRNLALHSRDSPG